MSVEQPRQGFLIVRKTQHLLDEYNKGNIAFENRDLLRQIRESVSFLDPCKYKGIARMPISKPFSEYGISGDLIQESDTINDCIITDLASAQVIYGLLDNQEEYEIIKVSLFPAENGSSFLGYDVGYWGGDCFSIICDTIVMPRWHPPYFYDLEDLAKRFRELNQYLLFETVREAVKFLEYYSSRLWAEAESFPGQIIPIQVSSVEQE